MELYLGDVAILRSHILFWTHASFANEHSDFMLSSSHTSLMRVS